MKKSFFLAIAAATLLISCMKTETVNDPQRQTMRFAAYNVGKTKSPVKTVTYPADYDMCVSAYLSNGYNGASGTSKGDYFDGQVFSAEEIEVNGTERTLWISDKIWPLSAARINFLAVGQPDAAYAGRGAVQTSFPADNHASASTTVFSANDITSDNFDQFDLMYAAGCGNHCTDTPYPVVDMKFKHALSWIYFRVAKNDVEAEIVINSIRMHGAYYGGTLSLENTKYDATDVYVTSDAVTVDTDNWSAHSDQKDDVYVPNESADGQADEVELSTTMKDFGNGILVVPAEYQDEELSFTISYTITQGSKPMTFEYTHVMDAMELEPAKKYIFNISLNMQKIMVSPEVEVWVDNPNTVYIP